ncbi:Two-component transcriptional response regulator, LuxR family [hydrothermal vent metagenome]|uniref:Two-component transcriptional response regulator, LuxR family n=1 Tax=hydrothermal vent metagenome TaxID=652676 RepID=A0A3B1BN70_9ZZZZ
MNILITDDEPLARERLRSMLDELSHTVVAEAANGKQALQLCEQQQVDVILLDIRMPGMDGLETAHHLMQLPQPPAIIFTTAYDEYALKAFKTHAVDYLLKPVRQRELDAALSAATRLSRAQRIALDELKLETSTPLYVSAQVKGSLQLIPIEDIYYFQADQKYVSIGYCEGEVLIDDSLVTIEQRYSQLLRIHRNALVAPEYIAALEKDEGGRCYVRLRDCDKRLEISRRHLANVRRWLKRQSK